MTLFWLMSHFANHVWHEAVMQITSPSSRL